MNHLKNKASNINFSDDEKEINEKFETDSDSDYTDEEVRDIINKAISKKINSSSEYNELECHKTIENNKKEQNKRKSLKISGKKNKSVLSLEQFNKKLMEEEQRNNKKFVSKRVEDKKKESGLDESQEFKRGFNARLPPYNLVNKFN